MRDGTPLGWRNVVVVAMLLAPAYALPTQYAKVAIVAVGGAAGGGDYADPRAALLDIGNWCGTRSAANPCLVKVMPGVYDVASGQFVSIGAFVHLEGSGANVTTIRGVGTSAFGLVQLGGSGPSELRSISVEATGDNPAVFIGNATARMSDVDVRASGQTRSLGVYASGSSTNAVLQGIRVSASGPGTNVAFVAETGAQVLVRESSLVASGGGNASAVENRANLASGGAPVRIQNSSLQASGAGAVTTVFNNGGTLALTNVDVSGEGTGDYVWAVYNAIRSSQWYGKLWIDGSRISVSAPGAATNATTLATWGACTTYVGATRLDGPMAYTPYPTGVVKCVASYNGSYDPVAANCTW